MTETEWLELVEAATGNRAVRHPLTPILADQIRREAWRQYRGQPKPAGQLTWYDLASALDRIIQNLTGIPQEKP